MTELPVIAPPNPYMSGSPKKRRIILIVAILAILVVIGVVLAVTVFSAPASKPPRPTAAATTSSKEVPTASRALSSPVAHSDIRVIQLQTLSLPAVGLADQQTAASAPAPAPAPAPPSYSINVATVGRQAALDECVWVRMSFSAAVPVPFVAAHNYCGGGIVLDMQAGQIVTLSGTGLDGTYVVSGAKDAWSGMEALDAMAGLSGDVILQSCYWSDDGRERLVALTRT